MRKNKVCALIQDLLPLYVDQLTSEETNAIIEEHLKECNACNSLYTCMTEEFSEEDSKENHKIETEREIDYLKKIRSGFRKRILSVVGGTILAIALFVGFKVFVYGTPSEQYRANIVVEDGTVRIEGALQDSKKAYSHYKVVEKDGEKTLVVYAAKKSFWKTDPSFYIEYSLEKAKEKGLVVENRKVTESGNVVSTLAANIYANKHPYIGDASKNGALAYAMGIGESLGNFTTELQTTKEPYAWTFHFENVLEASNETIFNEKMRGYAYVLLATVDNAGEITWTYTVKTEKGMEQKNMSATKVEAESILGEELQSFANSEDRIEELLLKVGLSPTGNGQSQLKEYKYRLTLTGRMPGAECDSTYVVLTNKKDLTFEEVSRSLYSNNSEDWLEDTVIVSMK